jgi:hypothetical protein
VHFFSLFAPLQRFRLPFLPRCAAVASATREMGNAFSALHERLPQNRLLRYPTYLAILVILQRINVRHHTLTRTAPAAAALLLLLHIVRS